MAPEFDSLALLAAAIRPDSGTVLHTQVEDALRRLIRAGAIPAGSVLPGELGLAAELGLSRHTIRHALGTLVTEGLVARERGRGTRVLEVVDAVMERRLDRFYAFAWEVSARGYREHSTVLEFKPVTAPPSVAQQLDLPARTPVQRLVRVRSAGGVPLVMETSYFPLDVAEGLHRSALESGAVYDEIQRLHGLAVSRAQETIRATVVSRAVARVLQVRMGAPAFRVERTTWSRTRAIEWQDSVVRGDRFVYTAELRHQRRPRAGYRPALSRAAP